MKQVRLFGFKIDNVFLLLFTLLSFLSAGAPDTLWTRVYGGDGSDILYSIRQTDDRGFISVGYTNSYGAGNDDVFFVSINSNGDTVWTRTYGGDGWDIGYSVQQTRDGGFIIAGSTTSFGVDSYNVYLIRTNSNGDTVWTRTYGGDGWDIGYSVQQTHDGGFIIAGTKIPLSGNITKHFYIIRTDSRGDTLWTKMYSGLDNSTNIIGSIQQTSDSGFIIAGTTLSNEDTIATENNFHYAYLIRTNLNGDTVWTRTYGGDEYNQGNSVQQTGDGGFIVVGQASTSDVLNRDVYMIRTNSHGDTLWTKTYGGDSYDEGNSIRQTNDGGFIIAGRTSSFGTGNFEIYLLRTNSHGDTLWTKTFNEGEGKDALQTRDGGYIIAGFKGTFVSSDVYLIRLEPETSKIKEYGIPSNTIKLTDLIVYNDHRNNMISIRYTLPFPGPVNLEVYDIKGKLMKTLLNKNIQKGLNTVKWDTKQEDNILVAGGIYYLKVSVYNSVFFKKITIVR